MIVGFGITCLAGFLAVFTYGARVERAYRAWCIHESAGSRSRSRYPADLRPER